MNDQEKTSLGIVLGLTAGLIWRSQTNPPKIYLGNYRVHHYHFGGLLTLLGILTNSPTAAGIGIGLITDDLEDVPIRY